MRDRVRRTGNVRIDLRRCSVTRRDVLIRRVRCIGCIGCITNLFRQSVIADEPLIRIGMIEALKQPLPGI